MPEVIGRIPRVRTDVRPLSLQWPELIKRFDAARVPGDHPARQSLLQPMSWLAFDRCEDALAEFEKEGIAAYQAEQNAIPPARREANERVSAFHLRYYNLVQKYEELTKETNELRNSDENKILEFIPKGHQAFVQINPAQRMQFDSIREADEYINQRIPTIEYIEAAVNKLEQALYWKFLSKEAQNRQLIISLYKKLMDHVANSEKHLTQKVS